MQPVTFGVVGLGGYGGAVCDMLLRHTKAADLPVRLVAGGDPLPVDPQRLAALREAGVRVVSSIDELLQQDVEAVWLPVPINLHRPFLEKSLAAGKAVVCEKPAAGCIQDVEAMLAARDRYKLPAVIAYQSIYDPAAGRLKRALLDGLIGPIRSATLLACWPRDGKYYSRNNWAGHLKRNDTWVLDSPANNALAHYVHLALFLMGPGPQESALPESVEAELYRANDIPNYDTCAIRSRLHGGASLLVCLTHACEKGINPTLVFHGENGVVRYLMDGRIEIEAPGRKESWPLDASGPDPVARGFARWLRGDRTQTVATLEMSRAHALLISGASEAVAVRNFPADRIHNVTTARGGILRTMSGIEEVLSRCVAQDKLISELGDVEWAGKPGRLDLRHYTRFNGPPQL